MKLFYITDYGSQNWRFIKNEKVDYRTNGLSYQNFPLVNLFTLVFARNIVLIRIRNRLLYVKLSNITVYGSQNGRLIKSEKFDYRINGLFYRNFPLINLLTSVFASNIAFISDPRETYGF
jgi:hypothetical protein